MWPLAIAVLLEASRQVRCQVPVEPEEEFYNGTVVSIVIPITEIDEYRDAEYQAPKPDCSESTSSAWDSMELPILSATPSSIIFYVLLFVAIVYLVTVVGCIKGMLKTEKRVTAGSKKNTQYHGIPTCVKDSRVPSSPQAFSAPV